MKSIQFYSFLYRLILSGLFDVFVNYSYCVLYLIFLNYSKREQTEHINMMNDSDVNNTGIRAGVKCNLLLCHQNTPSLVTAVVQ